MHILAGSSKVQIVYKSLSWVHKKEGLLAGGCMLMVVPPEPSLGVLRPPAGSHPGLSHHPRIYPPPTHL